MRKEKKIHNIERNLSFKRLKNQKKYSIQILGIAILACLLMQMGFQMTTGIQETFRENRKEIYGEWERILLEADSRAETSVKENPFIEKHGSMQIYGVLAGDYFENEQSNIGTIDEDAWKLGRLKLKEGSLPKNENEIAMEYSMLASLGYADRLGEEIRLEIIPSVEFSYKEEPVELTYILCGIIRDYQVNWDISSRHRLPAGVVTAEGGERIGNVLEKHMLIKAREGSESVYEDLENSEEILCQIEENFSDGSLVTDNIPFEKFFDSIRLFIAGAAICILVITISHSIDARESFWKFLHALGMEKKQMYCMIAWEAGIYCVVSIMLGSVGGVLCYKGVLPAFEKMIGKLVVKQISYEAVYSGILYSALVICISYFLSCMRLNRILKEGGAKKPKKSNSKRGAQITKFTPISVVLHRWRYAGVRKAFQILLLASVFVLAGYGLMEAKKKEDDLKMFKKMTGNGYFLDTETIANSPGVRKKSVELLSQIAGVESVETYKTNAFHSFTVDLSAYSGNKYFEEVVNTEKIYREEAAIDHVTLTVLGVDQWENLERFTRNLAEGNVSEEDCANGEFCILSLPPLTKTEQGYLGNPTEEEFQESFLMETEVKAGDMLRISFQKSAQTKEEKEIRIDGILRTSKLSDIRSPYPGGSGIQVIVGDRFWENYQIYDINEYYQEVKINVSEEADVLDTEEHILRNLKRIGTVNLKNYHQEYVQRQRELYSFVGMYGIVALFYSIMVFIVLYQMLEAEAYERRKSMEIFRALGMEERFLVKMRRVEVILMSSLSIIGGTVILCGCYLMKMR
ncbi:ABC transporter permease [Roseburia hominis]